MQASFVDLSRVRVSLCTHRLYISVGGGGGGSLTIPK